jgi:hypothetical protein
MSANGFREDELVSRRVKVGDEWQTRVFPIIGGRLRIIHETNSRLSIDTEILKLEPDFAVVRATLESEKGKFCGTGTASAQRDVRLADSLVELAESRAIARSLRFGGVGVEYTGFEEVTHVVGAEQEKEQTLNKDAERVFPEGNGGSKPDAAVQHYASGNGKEKPKLQSFGNGRATAAQVRALYALTKRANYSDEDIESLLRPVNAATFQDLSRECASHLISSLQTEVAA